MKLIADIRIMYIKYDACGVFLIVLFSRACCIIVINLLSIQINLHEAIFYRR